MLVGFRGDGTFWALLGLVLGGLDVRVDGYLVRMSSGSPVAFG